MGIWGAIILGLKDLLYFLEKECYINSDIYINQELEKLGFSFYNKCIKEKSFMIWMDNGACYRMSKRTTSYCHHIGLIYIDWPVQFLELNPIENLW